MGSTVRPKGHRPAQAPTSDCPAIGALLIIIRSATVHRERMRDPSRATNSVVIGECQGVTCCAPLVAVPRHLAMLARPNRAASSDVANRRVGWDARYVHVLKYSPITPHPAVPCRYERIVYWPGVRTMSVYHASGSGGWQCHYGPFVRRWWCDRIAPT